MAMLTLFYDGSCPLCVREMAQLRRHDSAASLQLLDLRLLQTQQAYPQIDFVQANRILTAINAQGELLLGLDATHAAWRAVGLGYRTAWLRWPLIRWLADRVYLWFAANRYRVSAWLTGKARCDECGAGSCSIETRKAQDR